MGTIAVQFIYLTGLKRQIFRNGRLSGSWDATGKASPVWSVAPMNDIVAKDGCPGFSVTVQFDEGAVGTTFQWGVICDAPSAPNLWAIPTEIQSALQTDRVRSFQLQPAGSAQVEKFYFTYARRLGAREVYPAGPAANPSLRFAVWAPNAQSIDVVFGTAASGYIADDGFGIDPAQPVLPMTKGADDVWETAIIPDFAAHEGLPYMYRIKNAQGTIVYRTDLFSRGQIGQGETDPGGAHWNNDPTTLDGTKSCSLVVSLDTIARDLVPVAGQPVVRIPEAEFWANEFTAGLPVPGRVQDLVIYELHIGALGFGNARPGNLQDAVALLPYLSDLGINAIELLPTSEFSGVGWGYGDSHHFVIAPDYGGRDQYKYFVRECHRRGIAVIQDVVYNHWDSDAERDEWNFDSVAPEQNIYYWYEGLSANYPSPDGGYLNNDSSGWTPRFWEEMVRHVFVSSAAAFMEECHVDGFRVDLTQAMHEFNTLNANGQSVGDANLFGAKTLREWSRTLRMIRPAAILAAEDYSGWNLVTQLPELGGLGFDVTWFSDFYHNLIGDSDMANGCARLLKFAGLGDDRGLDMDQFASVLYSSQYSKVVYNESHDEAGNDSGSMRTLPCAVNSAPLIGATRVYAEARTRVAFGLSLFSAGTPMFFMAEEVGAQKPYRYNDFMANREDILGQRAGTGANLFRFYQDAIRFSRRHPAVRSQSIDIIHVNGGARVIAFTRLAGSDNLLVVASLNNQSFGAYSIQTDASRLPAGSWVESFNSDAAVYGGANVGNAGAGLPVANGQIQVCIPANGFIVLVLAA
jgi:1,4-alpha-glucan branching enzyme